MARKLFGTDGMRGVAGEPPLDARTAHAVGVALGRWTQEVRGAEGGQAPEVVIGLDTRESGPWLAAQVAGGLKRSGVQARFAGVITTPGVAFLARTGHFIAGVMISASHNPYYDNGIKVIDHAGYKLADRIEEHLEELMFEWLDSDQEAAAEELADRDKELDYLYSDFLASTVCGTLCLSDLVARLREWLSDRRRARTVPPFGSNGRFNWKFARWTKYQPGLRIAAPGCVCAHGCSKQALTRESPLMAMRIALFSYRTTARSLTAMLSSILAGTALKRADKLPGDVVVATVMSNLGLEMALEKKEYCSCPNARRR